MLRIVAALALVTGLLLAAGLGSAFVEPEGRHRALGWMGLGAAAAVHALSAGFLGWSGRRIAARARRPGGPAWVEARVDRNRGKAAACQGVGLTLIALTAWSGWAVPGPWHRGLAALALGFQPGAFLAEGWMVAAQGRLAREVEGRSGEV